MILVPLLNPKFATVPADRANFGFAALVMNHEKLRRLYREERLQVRWRSGRKRALGTRAPIALPQGPNQRWSLDYASDAFSDGRRFRILEIGDDFTRECLAPVPDTSLPKSTWDSTHRRMKEGAQVS